MTANACCCSRRIRRCEDLPQFMFMEWAGVPRVQLDGVAGFAEIPDGNAVLEYICGGSFQDSATFSMGCLYARVDESSPVFTHTRDDTGQHITNNGSLTIFRQFIPLCRRFGAAVDGPPLTNHTDVKQCLLELRGNTPTGAMTEMRIAAQLSFPVEIHGFGGGFPGPPGVPYTSLTSVLPTGTEYDTPEAWNSALYKGPGHGESVHTPQFVPPDIYVMPNGTLYEGEEPITSPIPLNPPQTISEFLTTRMQYAWFNGTRAWPLRTPRGRFTMEFM